MADRARTLFVFYHYFPPDDVVSAIQFGDLCSGLVEQGWQVTVFPSIWSYRSEKAKFIKEEVWRGVTVRRLWRPRFRQSSSVGRFANALWMIIRWSVLALRNGYSAPDVLIIGTDPVMSILVARIWKFLRPSTKIVHWCFDLYPEAAIADGLFDTGSSLARFLRRQLKPAYRACSAIVNIGPCMRKLLLRYHSQAKDATIAPWALEEPAAPVPIARLERERIFGETPLAILYSGSFGRAHGYREILDLAKALEFTDVKFAFSVTGNREKELRAAVMGKQMNIPFVTVASADRLRERLASADIQIVALRHEWTGTVVPSKFFGALAIGRPVLFAGSSASAIAHWIREHHLGWILTRENVSQVAVDLLEYAKSPARQVNMQMNCFNVYHRHFARNIQITAWNSLLRSLLTT